MHLRLDRAHAPRALVTLRSFRHLPALPVPAPAVIQQLVGDDRTLEPSLDSRVQGFPDSDSLDGLPDAFRRVSLGPLLGHCALHSLGALECAEARPAPAAAVIQQPAKEGIYPPGNENRGCVADRADAPGHVAAVAMVTFDRPLYLRRAVDSLLGVHRKDPGNTCASRGLGLRLGA